MNNNEEKKTIKINPELFNLNYKTKKNKKKENTNININENLKTNVLNSKLLKKIRENKNNELKKIINKNLNSNNINNSNNDNDNNLEENDEFLNAINYLNNLKKEKKFENFKNKIQNKTLKNLYVHNDLPNELFNNKIKTNDEPPFGNLKNGNKPTYRTYIKTLKNISGGENNINNEVENIINNYIRPPTPPKRNDEDFENENFKTELLNEQNREINNNISLREQKLENIRQKLEKIQKKNLNNSFHNKTLKNIINRNNNNNTLENSLNNDYNFLNFENENEKQNIDNYFNNIINKNTNINNNNNITKNLDYINTNDNDNNIINNSQNNNENNYENDYENFKNKKIIKRTIRKKYNLGKLKNTNKVGILIKNSKTRRNILEAQKELKKIHINTIKKYLKKKGLIKIGSSAPNDILRKTFESVILSGDINNRNSDILLHNFLNSNESD